MQTFLFATDTAEAQVANIVICNDGISIDSLIEFLPEFSEVEVKRAISALLKRRLIEQKVGSLPAQKAVYWSEVERAQ